MLLLILYNYIIYTICHIPYIIYHIIIYHISYIIYHISYIIYHISYTIYHISYIIYIYILHIYTIMYIMIADNACGATPFGTMPQKKNIQRNAFPLFVSFTRKTSPHSIHSLNLKIGDGKNPWDISTSKIPSDHFKSTKNWVRQVSHRETSVGSFPASHVWWNWRIKQDFLANKCTSINECYMFESHWIPMEFFPTWGFLDLGRAPGAKGCLRVRWLLWLAWCTPKGTPTSSWTWRSVASLVAVLSWSFMVISTKWWDIFMMKITVGEWRPRRIEIT